MRHKRSPLCSLSDTSDVFIVDCATEVFVWVGKGCTVVEKKTAMLVANKYLQASGKPAWTPVSRVVENSETAMFKLQFSQWDKPAMPKALGEKPSGVVGSVAASRESDI